jgi:hypothetical protein
MFATRGRSAHRLSISSSARLSTQSSLASTALRGDGGIATGNLPRETRPDGTFKGGAAGGKDATWRVSVQKDGYEPKEETVAGGDTTQEICPVSKQRSITGAEAGRTGSPHEDLTYARCRCSPRP